MDLLGGPLEDYVATHTSSESELLKELNRKTHLDVLMPQMLSGHIQGRILSMFSRMMRPKRIIEVGTYTGYSGICLAEGLEDDGILHSLDINAELEELITTYWKEAGILDKTRLHIGNALEIIPNLQETWDLAFIDADKINYYHYYELILPSMRKGGLIIADNVLWSGKVTEKKKDKDTAALHEFNEKIQADPRVDNVLLPVRDGLMLIYKK